MVPEKKEKTRLTSGVGNLDVGRRWLLSRVVEDEAIGVPAVRVFHSFWGHQAVASCAHAVAGSDDVWLFPLAIEFADSLRVLAPRQHHASVSDGTRLDMLILPGLCVRVVFLEIMHRLGARIKLATCFSPTARPTI